jgi:AcrR family transcriptional regulator
LSVPGKSNATPGGAARGKPGIPKRDAERSRRLILDAALVEFSQKGYSGARIDSIATRAGMSKPMIYSYFGDKDDLYAAALREAYIQIRAGERKLHLENKSPEEAIRALVSFTLNHFKSKPWFISMLNTENLRGGSTIRKIHDVGEIQSRLLQELKIILERGQNQGVFRQGIDPVDLYITIASLCYFPISNAHTLRVVFNKPVSEDIWLEQRRQDAEEMIIRFLRPDSHAAHAEKQ